MCYVVPGDGGGVVLGEIVLHIMFSVHPIYHDVYLTDSVSDQVISHTNCS